MRVVTGATPAAVLVVPSTAVSTADDGMSRVLVRRAEADFQTVLVRRGLSAGGYLEVIPEEPGLRAGDRVVVGPVRGGPEQAASG